MWAARTAGDTSFFSVSVSVGWCLGFFGCGRVDPLGPDPYNFSGVGHLFTGSASGHNDYYSRDHSSLYSIAGVVNGSR